MLINFVDFKDILTIFNSELGIILYIFVYILSVIFLLPASWLSLLAGFLYGSIMGTLVVSISAFLGATISFFISKKFFSLRINKILEKFFYLKILEKVVNKGGLKLIILTRLSPLFPFSILNYFYGLHNTNYKDFFISLIFIIPGTYLYCSLGSLALNLGELQNIRSNNLYLSITGIIATSLVIYLSAKYANDVLKDSGKF